MTDIFFSYASKDRERVRPLVEALEQQGWRVWWDQEIPTGSNFGKVIERHLYDARCAIVAWTANSVGSDWVRNEASEAHSRGALIPVVLEQGIKLPLEFRQVETRDLSDWQPGAPHTQFERLFADLRRRLSASATAGSTREATNGDVGKAEVNEPAPARVSRPPLWRTATSSWWYALTLLVLPALFAGLLAWALMHSKVPSTEIELDLTVRRLKVQFGTERRAAPLPSPERLRSLALRNFARIELEPLCLSVAATPDDPQCAASVSGARAAIQGGKRSDAHLMALAAEGKPARVQLRPFNAVTPANVTFESDPAQPQYLTLRIDSAAAPTADVLSEQTLRLSLRDARLNATGVAASASDFDLNLRTGNPSALVSTTGATRGFMLRMEPDIDQPLQLIQGGSWPIKALDVGRLAQGSDEEISAQVEAGELRYADLPEGHKVALSPATLLKLAELESFWLTQLKFDPAKGAFTLQARGAAKRLASFVGTTRTDLRLSWFDRLWNDPKLRVLFTIITFVLGATPGLVQLLTQNRRA